MTNPDDRHQSKSEPFGRWLLAQRDRGEWVGGLADAARTDRTFRKDGDPEAVRSHLRGQQADGAVFQAVDDAESVVIPLIGLLPTQSYPTAKNDHLLPCPNC